MYFVKHTTLGLSLMALLAMSFMSSAQTVPEFSSMSQTLLDFTMGFSWIFTIIAFLTLINAGLAFVKDDLSSAVVLAIGSMLMFAMPHMIQTILTTVEPQAVIASTEPVSVTSNADADTDTDTDKSSSHSSWLLLIFPIIIGAVIIKLHANNRRDELNRDLALLRAIQEARQRDTSSDIQEPQQPPNVLSTSEPEKPQTASDIQPGKRKVILD